MREDERVQRHSADVVSSPGAPTAPAGVMVAQLGEGPIWHRTELWWVDILPGRVHRLGSHDGDEVRTVEVGGHVGAVAPMDGVDGEALLAAGGGFAHLAADGTVTPLAQPEAGADGRTRMNDGKCDPRGRFWAGSMAYDTAPGAGSLYRLDRDGTVATVLEGLTISNGLGWSPEGGTLYHSDSGPGRITAYDFYPATGAIGAGRQVFRSAPGQGWPDGLCVDDDGCLWVAFWDGSAVRRITPAGQVAAEVPLPVSRPTSCCFGGTNGATLYITSAWDGLSPEQREDEPLAGALFACDVGTTGPPATPCRVQVPG